MNGMSAREKKWVEKQRWRSKPWYGELVSVQQDFHQSVLAGENKFRSKGMWIIRSCLLIALVTSHELQGSLQPQLLCPKVSVRFWKRRECRLELKATIMKMMIPCTYHSYAGVSLSLLRQLDLWKKKKKNSGEELMIDFWKEIKGLNNCNLDKWQLRMRKSSKSNWSWALERIWRIFFGATGGKLRKKNRVKTEIESSCSS